MTMMAEDILVNVIGRTFDNDIGRDQYEKAAEQRRAMVITFYCAEPGQNCQYPKLEILLYAAARSVNVFMREFIVHEGKKIKLPLEKEAEWQFIANHDSCWKDALRTVLRQNADKLQGLEWVRHPHWYNTVPMTEELLDRLNKIRRAARRF